MNGESSRYGKLESMLQGGSSEPHNVPLNYLRTITNNFSDERLLGEGGFGTVYKGVLQNGEAIAVKKLNSSIPGVKDRQFENEAKHLMRLEHPNVVVLIGWCSHTENMYVEYNGKYIWAEKPERLLCLEYMPKGNLRGYLSDEFSGLGWDTRYKIIEGICYGLRYLHEEWQLNAPIVHMDLKPANILLDNNMVPKIADFGLSRLFSEEKTWTRTISRDGTLGYMSPEYINKGLISTKSDIFSLGVIIIEIVTGRRDYPDDTGTPSEEFIEMVLHNWSQRNGVPLEVDYQQIRRCVQIGLDCVETNRSKRPTISQIIKALHRPESAYSSNIKGVRSPANMVSSYSLLDTGMNPILCTVDRPQSGKREINCGETDRMERPAKKYTPGFSIYETFTVALHQWQKKTALWRIRVIFTTVVFVVLLKKRGTHARSRLPPTAGAVRVSRPLPGRRHPSADRSAAPAPAGGGVVVDSPTFVIKNHHAAAQHSAELPSSASEGNVGPEALPLKPRHQPVVTFAKTSGSLLQTSDDEDEYKEGEDDDDADAGEARPRTAVRQSSGSLSPAPWRGPRAHDCYRCGRGGSLWGRDKESCVACGARYCVGCVLRAMGSMPEGRKCLECIGRPVAESRRHALGRGSRVLRQLLSTVEVELVMRSERECAANQLRAEDVYVNGTKLSPQELLVLQGCPCPPSRLRPGFYWYDKVSGFWGKEGCKPHCIITANLNIGGSLKQKASNGTTGVLFNGREITKLELQMFKMAGVQCAGKPHFWVNADGTYQEEGQKTVKGTIWDKPIVKLLSPVLSLPTPNKAANQSGDDAVNIVNRAIPDYLEQRTTQKFLLVGSGASTILKQAKFLYESGKPFSVDEREDLKLIIQSNIYNYLGILLEGRERFEEESLADRRKISPCDPSSSGCCESGVCDEVTDYSLIPRLRAFSDWILKSMALGNLEDIFPAASREYAPLVEELWKDPAIQATYRRRNELPFLPPAANYLLDKAVDLSQTEYELSDIDILCADGITSSDGLASTEFSFDQPSLGGLVDEPVAQDTLRYQLIRINSRGLHENCKWLQMFDDVRLVIFCVAASDYDEYYADADGTIVNKMVESRQLFESIALHPAFEQMDFLLLLTKFDLLEQKISNSPLTSCDWFDDFTSIRRSAAMLSEMAAHYMATKFKRLFQSLTERKLYVSYVNTLDEESVRSAIRYGTEIVKWEEEKHVFDAIESVYSEDDEEPSSFTH